ncbi:MAG TPA: biotin--[acetyl-CoA-carboxylase] ligase [Anaerolineales bacterium]|nr:biotin--[acetyl-CoA-carboxylase] ligase [Anaerolineales bacterium]
MDQASVETGLADLLLPAIRFFNSIDSTNNEAWRWMDAGAPHGALVIADEQTAGRGRLQRRWVTVSTGGLAFSMALLAPPLQSIHLSRLTGLGALAACQALQILYKLPAKIKWPNDILLDDRKTGGVLVEARWTGGDLKAAVIGIGINIASISITPENLPPETLNFPVTCVERALGQPVERMELLHAILQSFFSWFSRLDSNEVIQAWEDNLAYRGQWVELSPGHLNLSTHRGTDLSGNRMGKVIGLTSDGSLRLSDKSGKLFTVQAGEIHLRPNTPTTPG